MPLTGAPILAAEALALGRASEVVPDADVEPRAIALASRFAQRPQAVIRAIKEAVVAGMNLPRSRAWSGLTF